MTDVERDARATPQVQAPGSAVVRTSAERLARQALRFRLRQEDEASHRRYEAWKRAEEAGTLDTAFSGPVRLDIAAPYLHRLSGGETEPAVMLARQVANFLSVEGLSDLARVLLSEYRSGSSFVTLRVPPQVHRHVATLAHAHRRIRASMPALGDHLDARATATWRAAGEITIRLEMRRPGALLAPVGDGPFPIMVPLMAWRTGDVVFADWELLGSILLNGEPTYDSHTTLTALLAHLLARPAPATPRLWAIAGGDILRGDLLELPQWEDSPIDPGDAARVRALLEELMAELSRRRGGWRASGGAMPQAIVLVIGELADLLVDPDGALVEALARDGPRHGIRLVAATARPAALGPEVLALFDTWLLSPLTGPQHGARLGVPRVADLPQGALMLPRRAGRQLPGYCRLDLGRFRPIGVHAAELTTLVQAMLLFRDTPPPERPGVPTPGPLQLRCAGAFAAHHGERALAARWNGRPNTKAWELLALLAVLPPGPVDKGRLTAMLWPKPRRGAQGAEGDEAGRDNRLYQAMADLRRLLVGQTSADFAEVIVAAGGGRFRLDETLVSSQAHRFLRLHRRAATLALDEALDEYERGCRAWSLFEEGLLRDLDPPWLDEDYDGRGPLARRYREQILELTGALAARCLAEERPAQALALARRLAAAEPTDEDAVCLLLECHGRLRDAGSAERAYQDHRAALRALYAAPRAAGNRMVVEPGQRVKRLRATLLAELGHPIPDDPAP